MRNLHHETTNRSHGPKRDMISLSQTLRQPNVGLLFKLYFDACHRGRHSASLSFVFIAVEMKRNDFARSKRCLKWSVHWPPGSHRYTPSMQSNTNLCLSHCEMGDYTFVRPIVRSPNTDLAVLATVARRYQNISGTPALDVDNSQLIHINFE